jgi:tetratricopeptide (TPR) repeat protein
VARDVLVIAARDRRRWGIAPAILSSPHEGLDGSHVLWEMEGPRACLLWQTLADVRLWAEADPDEREGLFHPDALPRRLQWIGAHAAGLAVEAALLALAGVLADGGTVSSLVVTRACEDIGRWAAGEHWPGTAIGFYQAAALASPHDADASLRVGDAALAAGQGVRAETWYRRTIGVARRVEEWPAYTSAYLGLARMAMADQRHGEVRTNAMKALRSARRHGAGDLLGDVHRILFNLAMARGETAAAHRHARLLQRVCRRGHPRLYDIGLDLARAWLSEAPERALKLLRALRERGAEPVQRAITLALLARAEALAGDQAGFEAAWREVLGLLRRLGDAEIPDEVPLQMTRAAADARDWEQMEQVVLRHLGKRGPASEERPLEDGHEGNPA